MIGEEAELDRLRVRAEEAIANEDPDGAATHIGRAALLAAQLAARHKVYPTERLYRAVEVFFRGQEDAYRAMALFQRAGGQPPASSGACDGLRLARRQVLKGLDLLRKDREPTIATENLPQTERLQSAVVDWLGRIDGLQSDFQCGR